MSDGDVLSGNVWCVFKKIINIPPPFGQVCNKTCICKNRSSAHSQHVV